MIVRSISTLAQIERSDHLGDGRWIAGSAPGDQDCVADRRIAVTGELILNVTGYLAPLDESGRGPSVLRIA